MSKNQESPQIPLPRGWKKQVRSAVLHVISLAQYAAAYTRGWAADSTNARVRLKAELDRANQELLLLREEIRIKDARLARIDPHRRPHYPPMVRCILKERPASPRDVAPQSASTDRVVTAKRPDHVWHVDLTAVPCGLGMSCTWLPFALPQHWPFCWWVLVAVDHFSRRAMGVGVFANRPDCRAVCTHLGQTLHRAGAAPRYIVCDRDGVFDCEAFRRWVKRKGIKPPRYGAVGKHGSIAVVERFILTLKQLLRQLPLIPLARNHSDTSWSRSSSGITSIARHTTFGGQTPNEVYVGRFPAHRKPRIEPRPRWPRGSPCAKPWALVAGKPGQRFETAVTFSAKRRHLPIVTLKLRRADPKRVVRHIAVDRFHQSDKQHHESLLVRKLNLAFERLPVGGVPLRTGLVSKRPRPLAISRARPTWCRCHLDQTESLVGAVCEIGFPFPIACSCRRCPGSVTDPQEGRVVIVGKIALVLTYSQESALVQRIVATVG